MIPDGRKVDSTRRLAKGLPEQPTDPYWGLVLLNMNLIVMSPPPLLRPDSIPVRAGLTLPHEEVPSAVRRLG